jgi:hypothetical protein
VTLLAFAVVVLVAGCGSAPSPPRSGAGASESAGAPPSQQTGSVAPSEDPSTSPSFHGRVNAIDPATRAAMTSSWHAGCPVPIDDLRIVTVEHWGFDGEVHHGEIIVHRDYAQDLLQVMRRLFAVGYPIERMVLVDVYDGDDGRSMAANNTSAFNCREVAGGPGVWSEHAFGRAIDVNPLRNPYVASGGVVLPPEGGRYADRSLRAKGMIHAGDVVVRAFAEIGWEWGGDWISIKDYQHFSATGR